MSGTLALEQRLGEALGEALGGIGFQLKMFSLREIDLGETGEIIQSTLRADAELEREQAMVKVRLARLENDTAMGELAASIDGDVLLRYRQLESWRDILRAGTATRRFRRRCRHHSRRLRPAWRLSSRTVTSRA